MTSAAPTCRSPFQSEGPITEKAQFCLLAVRAKGGRVAACAPVSREDGAISTYLLIDLD